MNSRSQVQVRSAGAGFELRVGGTSASWYQPGRVLTGSVWDTLAVGTCALGVPRPVPACPDILLLGLGGGSVARIIRAAIPSARLVGVELCAEVVAAARRAMALDTLGVQIHVEDAARFLTRPGRYDLVVEDCFLGGDGDLTKPLWLASAAGIDALVQRLAPGGVLVVDTIHESAQIRSHLRERFRSVVRIETNDCTNQVFVATDRAITGRGLRSRIRAHELLRATLGNLRLRSV
ncbi:MAG TPA: methyltransferase domain-containing protein [Polyangiaceae bacterium]|nr:methyltransferase domain-containing protein [Polyangiaceae bacterium]